MAAEVLERLPSGLLVHRIMKSRVQFLPWRIAQHSILSHKHLLLQTSNSNSWKPGRRCMAGQEAFLSAAIFSLFLILLQVCIACVLTIFEKKMGKKPRRKRKRGKKPTGIFLTMGLVTGLFLIGSLSKPLLCEHL